MEKTMYFKKSDREKKEQLMKEAAEKFNKENNKKHYLNGGGDQPLTGKQMNLIKRLARKKKKMTSGAYSMLRLKKDITEITGEEANYLIRELNAIV